MCSSTVMEWHLKPWKDHKWKRSPSRNGVSRNLARGGMREGEFRTVEESKETYPFWLLKISWKGGRN